MSWLTVEPNANLRDEGERRVDLERARELLTMLSLNAQLPFNFENGSKVGGGESPQTQLSGRSCCWMYCRMISSGAPPQLRMQ